MRKRICYSLFAMSMLCQIGTSQNTENASTKMFQLSTPRINVSSIFFDSFTTVTFSEDLPKSIIRYSLDGTDVNQNSKAYGAPLKLTRSAVIKAKMFHPDYKESDEVQLEVVKILGNSAIKQIDITPAPSEKYSGMGSAGLMDLKKGSAQFGGDKQWLGYQTEKISASLQFNKNSTVHTIVVSALTNQSNWIFAPSKLEVFHGDSLIGEKTYPKSTKETLNRATFLNVPVKKGIYDTLKVVIYPLEEIPEWHQGKGTTPWVFIDEIIIQ